MANGSEQGPWFWGGIIAIISAMATAISAMYKKGRNDAHLRLRDIVTAHTGQIAQLRSDHEVAMTEMRTDRDGYRQQAEDCQKDRVELRERVARMDERLKIVEEVQHDED